MISNFDKLVSIITNLIGIKSPNVKLVQRYLHPNRRKHAVNLERESVNFKMQFSLQNLPIGSQCHLQICCSLYINRRASAWRPPLLVNPPPITRMVYDRHDLSQLFAALAKSEVVLPCHDRVYSRTPSLLHAMSRRHDPLGRYDGSATPMHAVRPAIPHVDDEGKFGPVRLHTSDDQARARNVEVGWFRHA